MTAENQRNSVGEMHKREEKMADGRRRIIYYTFNGEAGKNAENETAQTAAASEGNENE